MLAVAPVSARPMHAGINYQRYLTEIDSIKAETDEWKAMFEKTCKENNWMPEYSSEERSSVDPDEDLRQRIFMSKQDVLEAQAANPNANFSIMTPFSALTKEEFSAKVLNSYVRGNTTRPTPTPSPAPPKRSLRQQDAYTFTSMQDMINSLMQSLQQQMGGSWTIGTVKPATDNTDTSTAKQWHWTIPVTTPATPAPAPVTPPPAPVTPAPIPVTAAPRTAAPRTYAPVTPAPTPMTRAPVVEPLTKKPSTPVRTEKATLSSANSVDWSASKCMSPVQSQVKLHASAKKRREFKKNFLISRNVEMKVSSLKRESVFTPVLHCEVKIESHPTAHQEDRIQSMTTVLEALAVAVLEVGEREALSARKSAVAATPAFARPMHAGIDYQRYLEEIDITQEDLDEWRSKFGDVAQKNGWMSVSEARSADDQEEDLRQRIFLTK
ncbi:hypothetical protein PI124_g2522 [Phytophthora idaei]|nr:hypothetical protein PI124_g2522 [Phytophthora idaei]